MALRQYASMAHDDEEIYDLAKKHDGDYEPPEYPAGLSFTLPDSVLEQAYGGFGEPGDTCRFSAMGEVTSTVHGEGTCRIEIELTHFAGEDGKFFALGGDGDEDGDNSPMPSPFAMTPCICLTHAECEKMDLDTDCERGDLIHLIGAAKIVSCSSTEYGGDVCTLQVTELTFNDESEESREHDADYGEKVV